MPEIRFEAKKHSVAVLDGYCSATGKCRTELCFGLPAAFRPHRQAGARNLNDRPHRPYQARVRQSFLLRAPRLLALRRSQAATGRRLSTGEQLPAVWRMVVR